MNDAAISPDELLPFLSQAGVLVVLYVSNGPLQDRARAGFKLTARRWEIRGVRCIVVRADVLPSTKDDRLVTIRVPQMRVFRDGVVLASYKGVMDIEEFLAKDTPED